MQEIDRLLTYIFVHECNTYQISIFGRTGIPWITQKKREIFTIPKK